MWGHSNTYARDLEGLYLPFDPPGFAEPELMVLDEGLRTELGLPAMTPVEAAAWFSGTALPPDSQPIALAYAGHQFGGFSPQLGDGRATLLGEVVDPAGRRWDIQLKGSGPTRFSRGGDGFASVGPILREQLVSASMHAMGVPTSRVLASVRTGELIRRETRLPGAVLARVASSHLRVGTFEFFAVREQQEEIARLVTYALQRHAAELVESENPALALLQWVSEQQATLVARWMSVGFVHGVMNTDNFTISGETLDYGPCAFMDTYEPGAVFSSIDHAHRYAYQNQPRIAQWNLARLAEALIHQVAPTLDEAVEKVNAVLVAFVEDYDAKLLTLQSAKLGLLQEDASLVVDHLDWMEDDELDFTRTFRQLALGLRSGEMPWSGDVFEAWHARWRLQIGDPVEAADRMDAVNPLYIPRNHLVEEALDAAIAGDLTPFRTMLSVVQRPFERQEGMEAYEGAAPDDFGPYRTFCGT